MPPDIDLDSIVDQLADRLASRLRAEQDKLVDDDGMAERIGVCVRSIRSMVQKQLLPQPILRTGGVTRWSWPEVMKFLAERRGRRAPRTGRGRYDRTQAGEGVSS